MAEMIYLRVYALSAGQTLLLLAVLFLVQWGLCCVQLRRPGLQTGLRLVYGLLWLFWLAVVLWITLFSRESGARDIHLFPLEQLLTVLMGGERELLRSAWMNGLLFVPGGLLLEALLLTERPRRRWLMMVLALLAGISIGIELAQGVFALGRAEADDVLCNVLGGSLGTLLACGAQRAAASRP